MKVFDLFSGINDTSASIIRIVSKEVLSTLPITVVGGSLHMLESHLFNMDYSDYLRMQRDVYGGTIIGKNSLFPFVYFYDKDKAQTLVDELNKRVTKALKVWKEANKE